MIKIILLAVLGLAAASAYSQNGELPKSRPGQLADEIIKLCATPKVDELTRWLTSNFASEFFKMMPAHDFAKVIKQECVDDGGYQIISIVKSEPKNLVLMVQGRKSQVWSQLFLKLDDKGKATEFGTNPSIPPESSLPKDLSDAAIAREIEADVQRLSRLGLFSGIVQLARGTSPIVTAVGGYADRTKKNAISGSTQFTLASLGKMFTAVAVGQLVEQKKMSFDDKVGKFFPDFPNKTIRDQVTVGMLLSHFAGMGTFLDKRTPAMLKNGVKRAEEFLPILAQEELLYAPGAMQGYSNSGMVLAGAIVEKVSGEDYPAYIRKHIFEVSGMIHSDPNNIPFKSPQLVTPYTRMGEGGPYEDWRAAEPDVGSPAGGAVSTADDLVRFADALRSGKLVSLNTLAELKKPRSNQADAPRLGYGMYNRQLYGHTIVGHGGGTEGVSTELALMLDAPYTMVLLENFDAPAGAAISGKIKALMAAKARANK